MSRPQTDPSAGALGGLDDHRKHARARTRGEAGARTHTLLPGPRGDPGTPLQATNPRSENTSARQFTLACPRKQKSQEPSVETAQTAVIGEGRTRSPWQLEEEREEEALVSKGETAVTPPAGEVRSPGAPGEGHIPGRVVIVSCKRVTCPRGNHLTRELLSVLLRVARSRHPPAPTTPTRGPCALGPPSARSALPTHFLLGALPRLAPAGHLLTFQGSALQPATTNLPRASHTSVNSPALKCWWITEDSFKKTTYSSGQKTELHAWAIAGSVTP